MELRLQLARDDVILKVIFLEFMIQTHVYYLPIPHESVAAVHVVLYQNNMLRELDKMHLSSS